MAEPSPDKIVIGAIGPLITTVIGAAIGWLPGGLTGAIGSALTTLLAAVGGISGLVFSLMYKRYVGVLSWH
jgi:CDP-diglyceride synthetase